MAILRSGQWLLILICVILLQMHPVEMLRVDSLSRKLRKLNEQFQQFQALTQTRLEMLALNQNKNYSENLENHVQVLSEHWRHMSQDLELFKQSTTQEIDALREWRGKLEKKSKRLEGRLALMERNMRENRRHAQKQRPDPSHDFFNLTLELQNQEERLAALQAQRDELLVGLKGLQESLKNQALRVTRLEGQHSEVLLFDRSGNNRDMQMEGKPLSSKITHLENDDLSKKNQSTKEGLPGMILGRHTQSGPEGISHIQIKNQSDAATLYRSLPQPHAYKASPKQTKHPNAQQLKLKPDSYPQVQIQYANVEPQVMEHMPQPDPYSHQSKIQMQAQTNPYSTQQDPLQSGQTIPYQVKTSPQEQQKSKHQTYSHSRIHLEDSYPQASNPLPQAQSEPSQPWASMWDGEEKERDTKKETSAIHNLLQLPLRQKIPAQPFPKKDATICNVDSMLVFPSASADNYVTFSLTVPDLPELSVCLWLRVETSYVGTLLSYATDDNDNQLVLYGRSSASSSSAFSSPSHLSFSSSAFSAHSFDSSSSPSLDLIIGDPVYRSLPVLMLLDARWHHLCIVWSSIQGHFWHYSDRHLTSSGSNFRKGWEIPGGGSLVLGQEQDSIAGGFDSAEGFAGQMAGFRVWNRVLSASEVEGVAEGRGVPRGVVLDMEDIKEVHGEVQQMSCECLEFCVGI
ncbi:pentraxin-4 [Antennarius striatus]|uniref:pentraxin-4 n=1 Tax=Antennarius striatus TaxID=241820 RepID=UPI0035B0B9F2